MKYVKIVLEVLLLPFVVLVFMIDHVFSRLFRCKSFIDIFWEELLFDEVI